MSIESKKWNPRPRVMGRVINWNRDRKFGFICCFDDGQSYFAHVSQLKDDYELLRGSIVEFEIWIDKKRSKQTVCG